MCVGTLLCGGVLWFRLGFMFAASRCALVRDLHTLARYKQAPGEPSHANPVAPAFSAGIPGAGEGERIHRIENMCHLHTYISGDHRDQDRCRTHPD